MNPKDAERRWKIIESYIPSGSCGAELGVFKGHLSAYFLKKNPEKLYLVDPWYRMTSYWSWLSGEDPSTLNALRQVLDKFEGEINAGTVVPVIDFSFNFLKTVDPKSLDFIYLDTSHNYENTLKEIEAASLALKDDGLLLGDDWHYDEDHRHFGVTKAVTQFIENGRCEMLFKPKGMQWGVKFNPDLRAKKKKWWFW